MNTSAASQRFDDLEGMLRSAVEQIAAATPPVEVAERVLERAAKWCGDEVKRQDPHPGPLPKGEGAERRHGSTWPLGQHSPSFCSSRSPSR